MNEAIDAPPGSPAAFQEHSQHIPLSVRVRIANLIGITTESWAPDTTDAEVRRVDQLTAQIANIVAEYVDSREVSLLSSLNSAAYHVARVQKQIRDRRA